MLVQEIFQADCLNMLDSNRLKEYRHLSIIHTVCFEDPGAAPQRKLGGELGSNFLYKSCAAIASTSQFDRQVSHGLFITVTSHQSLILHAIVSETSAPFQQLMDGSAVTFSNWEAVGRKRLLSTRSRF